MKYPLVVIESTERPGYYLRFLALAHEGDKRWSKDLRLAEHFIDFEDNRGAHNVAKRRGLQPHEYKITPLGTSDDENKPPERLTTPESI